ncbi:MAG: FAD:protein FMN transferase, partial [Oscillospiraceae bacterium]|nr:FAD:protein FMN transferase [Oscillospiraceae bacterium]
MKRAGAPVIAASITAAIIAAAMLTSCAAQASYTAEFFAMDTVMGITAHGRGAEDAVNAAKREIERLEHAVLSAAPDADAIAAAAEAIRAVTGGAFDVYFVDPDRAAYDLGGIAKGYAADAAAAILRGAGIKSALVNLGG